MLDPNIDIRKETIDAMVEFEDDGMTVVELAKWLGVDLLMAETQLVFGAAEGIFLPDPERRKRKVMTVWTITAEAASAYRNPRNVEKLRKCLTCSEMFLSSHAGNRICEKCKEGSFDTEIGGYDDVPFGQDIQISVNIGGREMRMSHQTLDRDRGVFK